jgi:hypothetical protein
MAKRPDSDVYPVYNNSSFRPSSDAYPVYSNNAFRPSSSVEPVTDSRYRAEVEAYSQYGVSASQDRWYATTEAQMIEDSVDHFDIMMEMAEARVDQDFHDELSAVDQWLRVLSKAEQTASMYQWMRSMDVRQLKFLQTVIPLFLANQQYIPLSKKETKLSHGLDVETVKAMYPEAAAAIDEQRAKLKASEEVRRALRESLTTQKDDPDAIFKKAVSNEAFDAAKKERVDSKTPVAPKPEPVRPSAPPSDPSLSEDIPQWLRSIRLHKYTDNLKDLSSEEMLMLDDEALQARGVNAVGARIKLLKVSLRIPATLQLILMKADAPEGSGCPREIASVRVQRPKHKTRPKRTIPCCSKDCHGQQ